MATEEILIKIFSSNRWGIWFLGPIFPPGNLFNAGSVYCQELYEFTISEENVYSNWQITKLK
jgi:hypothetical protein